MSLDKELMQKLPELTSIDFSPLSGSIKLKDDGDGIQYIHKWEYHKPIPEGLSLGKPTA
jgi:hypothetical protein